MADKQLLSADLLQQIEESARAQHREPADLVQEAVREYLDKQSWQQYVESNERKARKKCIEEADVDRLISEVRRENGR